MANLCSYPTTIDTRVNGVIWGLTVLVYFGLCRVIWADASAGGELLCAASLLGFNTIIFAGLARLDAVLTAQQTQFFDAFLPRQP